MTATKRPTAPHQRCRRNRHCRKRRRNRHHRCRNRHHQGRNHHHHRRNRHHRSRNHCVVAFVIIACSRCRCLWWSPLIVVAVVAASSPC